VIFAGPRTSPTPAVSKLIVSLRSQKRTQFRHTQYLELVELKDILGDIHNESVCQNLLIPETQQCFEAYDEMCSCCLMVGK
jgi:hypothetical protein